MLSQHLSLFELFLELDMYTVNKSSPEAVFESCKNSTWREITYLLGFLYTVIGPRGLQYVLLGFLKRNRQLKLKSQFLIMYVHMYIRTCIATLANAEAIFRESQESRLKQNYWAFQ